MGWYIMRADKLQYVSMEPTELKENPNCIVTIEEIREHIMAECYGEASCGYDAEFELLHPRRTSGQMSREDVLEIIDTDPLFKIENLESCSLRGVVNKENGITISAMACSSDIMVVRKWRYQFGEYENSGTVLCEAKMRSATGSKAVERRNLVISSLEKEYALGLMTVVKILSKRGIPALWYARIKKRLVTGRTVVSS